MGALPNFQTQIDPRKPAGKARKPAPAEKCKPRTIEEIRAEYRHRTNYAAGTGYIPLFHALTEDLRRLTSGEVCTWLVIYTLQNLSLQRGPKENPSMMPVEAEMSVPELALRCVCEERSVNRALEYLEARGMATVARLSDSRFVISLRYRDWSKIEPDYEEWDEAKRAAEAAAAGAELEAEGESDTPAPIKPGIVPITTKPRVVRAGHRERSVPITSGTKSFRLDWQTPGLDLRYQAVIDSGEVIVTACIAETKKSQNDKRKSVAKRAESVVYREPSGHGCPENAKTPPNEGIGNHPRKRGLTTTRVEHPRAPELCALFDPLLLKSCHKSLSEDPAMLLAACEAIGKADHDFLVKAVIDRSARELKLSHVKALCKEIAANWERVKHLPPAKRLPSREEIDEMIRQDKEKLAAANRAARRKS